MGPGMPVFDESALNDNDETLAYLGSILSESEGSTRAQRSRHGLVEVTSLVLPRYRHVVCIPLIVGVAVSITIPSL